MTVQQVTANGATVLNLSRVQVVDVAQDPAAAAADIYRALTDVGFFYVSNHGVDSEVVTAAFREFAAFFALPLEEKLTIRNNSFMRGYMPLATQTLGGATQTQPDTKEGMTFSVDVPAERAGPLQGPNQWPSKELLPKFQPAVQRYFDELKALGLRLLRLFAIALGAPPDYFAAKFDNAPPILLRPLRYEPVKSALEDGIVGAGAHTDFGCITLLVNDSEPGLQIWQDGSWCDVPPVPGTFVVNVGQMMQMWTNDVFKANLHRVVNLTGRERYSIAFFLNPDMETVVAPLPQCTSEENPPKHAPIFAGQHLLNCYTKAGYRYTGAPAAWQLRSPEELEAAKRFRHA